MNIIRLVIADDHEIFRKGLRIILNEMDEVKVIGEAQNGHELFEILKNATADLVLMDIRMPVMDGIEATRRVVEKYPSIKVIALTMFEEISYFNQMIEAGAEGFLLKKTNKDELQRAINQVMAGENYFSEEFISNVNRNLRPSLRMAGIELTDREQEVLELICKGMSNAEISKYLGVSARTVDGHRAHLLEKTGAKNSPHLVMFAIKNGLIKA
ncbi:MAG TPA: response regulator transcription factor [Bacteroidales bacterium]|jgi:DNA-binding NarL/FixJ family response regulator|nr:response regulator transcription factor [Bacteroidales bacterium]HNZ42833.1 response regulator transcription factor [Bacteroidales bacterium]HPB26339.1 response regulator transcription factor [Bacteroidales bacterium]HPI30536.1 response regulator transcription factor [Bacteroidales bacterium]HQN17098.1 response regulator transcription factor [Bacteroidales bacterium]